MSRHYTLIVTTIIFVLGGIVGYIGGVKNSVQTTITPPVEVRENSSEYKFINPLLFSRVSKSFYTEEYRTLNDSVTSAIQSTVDDGFAESVSVYFRDLNTGHWTGIREDQKYHPSSMLKVLGLMSYLRRSEENPSLLQEKLYYTYTKDPGQYYQPEKPLPNMFVSTEKILENMIMYSDNSALHVLDVNDKANTFNKAYHAFQLPLAKNIDDIDGFMSPRSYSALFRTLYNSTYLSREMSEKALKLLSETTFNKGLVAGVPKGIVVAHKFGEHTYELTDNIIESRELHDCGIVYYPQHPYLVCIMTKGDSFPKLETVISDLSRLIYSFVDKKVKNGEK